MANKGKVNKKQAIRILFLFLLLIIFIVGITIATKPQKETTLTQFSPTTGRQMMGYAIQTDSGKLIMIDGGNIGDAEEIEQYILDHGGEVEAWLITHIHTDHVGAFTQVIQNPNITIHHVYASIADKQWYETNEPSRKEDIDSFFEAIEQSGWQEKIEEPQVGQIYSIDSLEIEILGIKNPEITKNAMNNSSMVFQVITENTSILFLGDTGEESSQKLLENKKEKLKSDMVQVAHHGQAGASKELYQAVQPKIALWPTTTWLWNNDSGAGEDSGPWKTKETRGWLEELGVKENYLAQDGMQTLIIP